MVQLDLEKAGMMSEWPGIRTEALWVCLDPETLVTSSSKPHK